MKKLLVVIAIVAVILLVSPFFIGSQTKTIFYDQVEKTNTNPALNLEITDYQKGWFSSTAVVTLKYIAMPDLANEPFELVINNQIQHGPLLWSAKGFGIGLADSTVDFILPAELQSELDKLPEINKDTLKISSRTAFDLSTQSFISLNPININKDGVMFDVKPAEGEFSYTMAGDIHGNFEWQGLKVSEGDNKYIQVNKISLNSDQQLVSGELFSMSAIYSGSFQASVAEITFSDSQLPPTEVKSVETKVVSSVKEGDLMDFNIVLKAEALKLPNLSFSDFIYDISLDNIDINVVKKINETVTAQQGNNQNPMLLAAEIQGLLPELLAKNPVMKINKLGVTTPQGDITSNLKLAIDPNVYDANNPMTMMVAVDALANGEGPEAFFNQLGLGPQIEQYIQQNLLVRDNDKLKFDFVFKDGQALLNGSPMPLGAF